MDLIVQHYVFKTGPTTYGGRIKVTIAFGGGVKTTKEFTYGDQRYDTYATEQDARDAVLEFCDGVQAAFTVISLKMKGLAQNMTLNLESFNDFVDDKRESHEKKS